MSKCSMVALSAIVALACTPAAAASFNTESGFGSLGSLGSCKSGNSVAAFATGTALSGADVTGGCVGYFTVDIDTSAKTITLTGVEFGNYESGFLAITGISGVTITSLSTISSAGLFAPTYYGDPSVYGGLPTPVLSFTGNSIYIGFTQFGDSPPQFTYTGAGGTAVFAYNSGAVPEPAAWALMIGGFGLAGAALRRRRSTTLLAA